MGLCIAQLEPLCRSTQPSHGLCHLPCRTQEILLGAVRLTCLSSLLDGPICPVGQGSGHLLLLNVSVTRSVIEP